MSSTSKPHVSLEFEVEKILGVSSDGSYQVQWAPSWVNKLYLVGCEHLIDEFLHQQREVKTEPAHPLDNLTDEENGNEIHIDAEPRQSDQYGIEMKSEPGQLLDSLSITEDKDGHSGRNNMTKDEPHQSSLQELSFQEPGEEIHMEADTCVAAKLSSGLNYGSDRVVFFNDNDALDNTVTKYCNQLLSLDIQQKQQQQQQQQQKQQQVIHQHNSLPFEEEDEETPHIPREDICFETEITSSKKLEKSSPPGIDASGIVLTVENLSTCDSSSASGTERYSLRSRHKVVQYQNEHRSSDKQHGNMEEIIYDSKFSGTTLGNDVECCGPRSDDHSCDVGQNFSNSTNPESELKGREKRRRQCVALQHIREGGEEEPNAHLNTGVNVSECEEDGYTGERSDVHSTLRFDEYSSSSNSLDDGEERPVLNGVGLGEDESTTLNSQPQHSLGKKSSSARKKRLVRHLRTHSRERPYACDQCSFSCVTKGGLRRHQRTHTRERPYACDQCSFSCVTKGGLRRHQRTHTRERPYACDQCSFSYATKGGLRRHQRTHTRERPYACDQCSFSYATKGGLTRHQRTHTRERPFACDQCSFSYATKGGLTRHQRTHTGEKPYSCMRCLYSCSQKYNLKSHMRIHTAEKPYSCKHCSFCSSDKTALYEHLLRHRGERPYQCDQCPYSSVCKRNLARHLRTHSGEKPHACDQCTFSCTQKSDLKRRMRPHAGEKPYSCRQCPSSFSMKHHLTRHMCTHTAE